MKNRHRAEEQHKVDDERQIRHEAGKPIVDQDKKERQGESKNAGVDTAFDRVSPERGRDAAFLFHAHRGLQRVFQDTREISRLFFMKLPCDGSAPTVNSFTNLRGGLDLAIKDDGETFANVSLGQFPER